MNFVVHLECMLQFIRRHHAYIPFFTPMVQFAAQFIYHFQPNIPLFTPCSPIGCLYSLYPQHGFCHRIIYLQLYSYIYEITLENFMSQTSRRIHL